ncbi:sigma-70 family RNA polymerase sigma factor [Streptomyces sp. H27-D2]|uniref:sigma-70 family RNA polymerase sigma factor n=1 Tax=Streptomyces sp. H27-D2 TaxID=3046304 RepID=UPI002DBF269E|nr:sigma-70 family RNA polymerase sigma factor [Streptomyces sp. H27-D2]MEC4015229.1 sigma-70 family RNA polymerase sigma factor [Streptomyces sp. H27-D2]
MMPATTMERRPALADALRATREERGWSVSQLVMRMRQVAMAQGIELASKVGAVETCVRNWERGKYAPSAVYQGVLLEVYGTSRESLGLPEEQAARDIDAERWGRIFEQYYTWVLRRIQYSIRDHALAEDLASEVFLKVGKSLHAIVSDDESLHGYMAVQVRWVIADHLRTARVRHEMLAQPADDDAPHHDPVATDDLSMPETYVTQRVDIARLLTLLPEQQRQVFALRILDGLNGNQVAVQMGVSAPTVSRRYAEAVSVVRRHMSGEQAPVEQSPEAQWMLDAWSAALAEAATGQRFTARHLVERHGLAEPSTPFQWAPLFRQLKDEGVIRPAGYVHGSRRAWVGVSEQSAVLAVAA